MNKLPLKGAFSVEERAAIDFWFRQPDVSPDLKTSLGRFLESQGLKPEKYAPSSTCSAFVGRLVLSAVEERLPQMGDILDDIAMPGRQLRDNSDRYSARVQLLPRLLLEINWAEYALGVNSPCAYYATWLPGYYRWVVTASSNSCSSWNHWDRCIGWISDTADFIGGVHDILIREWRNPEFSSNCAWEDLWSSGVVAETQAYDWRNEAWPDAGEVVSRSIRKSAPLCKAEVVRIDSFARHKP